MLACGSNRLKQDNSQSGPNVECVRRFECRSDGTYMQVFYVGLEPTGDEPDETEYTGPVCIGFESCQGAMTWCRATTRSSTRQ